ncbi:acyl-CoA thioesterase [Marinobacterium rhizophilum]|uniref:Acyl-CoA thioesterase n=1 Tax=Marinobacterium rhizophilum TaxID=420402 RepID=A0ABY5HDT1_9GAMM|nr:acyl-CoA thioesterase [Marinobacterium rhizophilum]UTW10501.1 acyl-CoA thioesterase [Marinobacterium rhizophilum]
MPEPGKLLHSCHLPLRWGDMDAYGHINNVQYIRYLEEARVQLLIKLGAALEGAAQAPVIINVGYTFLRPLVYPGSLRIDCFVAEPGRSSFMIYYHAYADAQPEVRVGEGYSKVVWMDHAGGHSVQLPDSIRAQL